ncbi:MAG: type II secretion system protein [Candidatus Omnitrophota bacterium]
MSSFFRSIKSFTLIEVVIAVVIMAFITGVGITNYYRSQELTRKKLAESQLKILQKAQDMHFARYEKYYPVAGDGDKNILNINEDLDLYFKEEGFIYLCDDDNDDSTYSCEAARNLPSSYTLSIDESVSDPACSGNCP